MQQNDIKNGNLRALILVCTLKPPQSSPLLISLPVTLTLS